MKRLRIAQVTNLQESVPPKGKNGLEQLVYDLTEELVKLGHEVTLFGTADSETSARLVPVWPGAVSRDQHGGELERTYYAVLAVSEALARHREFDVVHMHAGYLAAHWAGLIDTPVVCTIHNPLVDDGTYKSVPLREYKKRSQDVQTVMVSEFQAKKFGLPCTVVHNGLPVEEWELSETPGEYLAFLGYMTPDKGAAEAVQAVMKTEEKLVIAGSLREDDARGQEYFKEKIEPWVDGEKIKFVGVLNPEEKKKFLREAKGTLMPIQWDEPFGLVAIESMACGTPVVAWNRAAMPEIIEDRESGYLVNSVDEMVERIGEVGKLSRMKARERVEEKFSAKTMAKRYVELYESTIG